MRVIYGPTATDMSADGAMWMRRNVDDDSIKRTFQNIDDWKQAAIQRAMTQLQQEFGELSQNESRMARETIADHLQQILDSFILEWGLTVSQPVDVSGNGNGRDKHGS